MEVEYHRRLVSNSKSDCGIHRFRTPACAAVLGNFPPGLSKIFSPETTECVARICTESGIDRYAPLTSLAADFSLARAPSPIIHAIVLNFPTYIS